MPVVEGVVKKGVLTCKVSQLDWWMTPAALNKGEWEMTAELNESNRDDEAGINLCCERESCHSFKTNH